jgi:hypothetical protein
MLIADPASSGPVMLATLLEIDVGIRGWPNPPPLTLIELRDCSNQVENNASWEAA